MKGCCWGLGPLGWSCWGFEGRLVKLGVLGEKCWWGMGSWSCCFWGEGIKYPNLFKRNL